MTNKELIATLRTSKTESDRMKCIQLLNDYLKNNSDDIEAWYDLAGCLDFLGFELEAQPHYRKVYELGVEHLPEKKQMSFFVGYGSTLRNNGKLDESEAILKEGIALFPYYHAYKFFLALTLHSKNQFRQSSEVLFSMCGQLPTGAFDGYEKVIQKYAESLKS